MLSLLRSKIFIGDGSPSQASKCINDLTLRLNLSKSRFRILNRDGLGICYGSRRKKWFVDIIKCCQTAFEQNVDAVSLINETVIHELCHLCGAVHYDNIEVENWNKCIARITKTKKLELLHSLNIEYHKGYDRTRKVLTLTAEFASVIRKYPYKVSLVKNNKGYTFIRIGDLKGFQLVHEFDTGD